MKKKKKNTKSQTISSPNYSLTFLLFLISKVKRLSISTEHLLFSSHSFCYRKAKAWDTLPHPLRVLVGEGVYVQCILSFCLSVTRYLSYLCHSGNCYLQLLEL